MLTVLIGAAALGAFASIEFIAPMQRMSKADFDFGPMESGVPAVQTLGATKTGLAAVRILASREGGAPAPAILSVRIRQGNPPRIVREKTLQAPLRSELQPLRFSFEPLPEIQSASMEIVTWISGDNEIFLGGAKGDEYPGGRLYYRDQPTFDDQDLSFTLYRKTTVLRLLSEIKDRSASGFVAAAATGLTVALLISVSIVKAGSKIAESVYRRRTNQSASSSPPIKR